MSNDKVTDKKKLGLYGKYEVHRTDGNEGPGTKHSNCDYFVLDITHDPGAFPALHAYIGWAKENGYDALAKDLEARLNAHAASYAALGESIPARSSPPSQSAEQLRERYRPLKAFESIEPDFKRLRASRATRAIMERFMSAYPPNAWHVVESEIREEVRTALSHYEASVATPDVKDERTEFSGVDYVGENDPILEIEMPNGFDLSGFVKYTVTAISQSEYNALTGRAALSTKEGVQG